MGWDYWYAVQRTAFDTGWGRGSLALLHSIRVDLIRIDV